MTTETSGAETPGTETPGTETSGKSRAVQWEDVRLPPWLIGIMGAIALIAFWWILAQIWVSPTGAHPIPTPPEVIGAYASSGWDFFARNFLVTLEEAGIGFLWGNGLALLMSAIVLIVPRLEGVAMQLAILTYCVPIVAIGMIAVVLITPPTAGDPSGTAILLAALSCFFTTVVGALLGLKSADKTSLDLITVYGGSKFTQLVKVRVIAALPATLNALQIAVPAAFLGAVLGEFFGRISYGVGLAMVLAQQASDAPLVWALALASGAVSLAGFGIVGLLARVAAPWSKGSAS